MTQESILKNVVVFAPDLRAISGTVSKDTGAENGPAFTGGSVRYIDPETLTGLGTIRSRMARICRCLLYTSPSPRDRTRSRMPSSA